MDIGIVGQSAFHLPRSGRVVEDRVVLRDKDGIEIDPEYVPEVIEYHFVDTHRLPKGYYGKRYFRDEFVEEVW